MSTRSCVDEIQLKAQNWPRDGRVSILSMMQRVLDDMYSKPCAISILIDKDTGKHPILSTVAGQYEYEIPNVTIKVEGINRTIRIAKIIEIYIESASLQDYAGFSTDSVLPPGWDRTEDDRIVMKGNSFEALENSPARFIFTVDPGTTTDKYFMLCLIEPLKLTSDIIPLMIPRNWEKALIDGALGYIEYYDYGRSDRLQTFQEYWLAQFRQDQNTNTHQQEIRTRIRRC